MTGTLSHRIARTQAKPGEIVVFGLGQAGVLIKTASGATLAIDPYLSDCVERLAGFRRLVPAPIRAEDLDVDVVACTHSHPDHLDVDALPILAARGRTRFVGAPDCVEGFRGAGLAPGRFVILRPGEEFAHSDLVVRATFADHGKLAPDAVGFFVRAGAVTILNVGDTGYAPERIMAGTGDPVDVMIAPINGAFGNLTGEEACRLAALVRPRLLIGNHFGMFAEHGGDPAGFLAEAEKLPAVIRAQTLAAGGMLRYRKEAAP
ncbi:MAG: MBL fold metallo-hydrolase [Planctomycetota bacterium]|nr:MBL fold metallo-hydrolase [Planctomycetota bacterium]